MRFLADENVEGAVVRRLRHAGHDVFAVSEAAKRLSDTDVLRLSVRESRVLVTNDKDFAELVFLRRSAAVGIVLMRMPDATAVEKARRVLDVAHVQSDRLFGALIVVQPDAARRRPFLAH